MSYWSTDPRLTEEEIKNENDQLPASTMERVQLDLFPPELGAMISTNGTQQWTKEEMAQCVTQLREELSDIPPHKKKPFLDAEQMCPQELSDKRFELFIRREEFNIEKAAKRVIQYWKQRQKVFGPDRWYLPMTQEGALRDNQAALKRGVHQMLPDADPAGRPLFLFSPHLNSRKASGYGSKSLIRAGWYIAEKIMEEYPNVSDSGLVFLVSAHEIDPLDNLDFKHDRFFFELEKTALPFRFAAIHHGNSIRKKFEKFIKPFVFCAMEPRLRARFRIHYGCDRKMLETLAEHGLTENILPSCMAGEVHLDHSLWLEETRRTEMNDNTE